MRCSDPWGGMIDTFSTIRGRGCDVETRSSQEQMAGWLRLEA